MGHDSAYAQLLRGGDGNLGAALRRGKEWSSVSLVGRESSKLGSRVALPSLQVPGAQTETKPRDEQLQLQT